MTEAPAAGTPFPRGSIGFKTSPQNAEWAALDEIWAAAGEMPVFAAGWLNDHLTDTSPDDGPSFEGLTLLAALVHRVPGKWVGHGVLSNTFRHPAVLAKAATVLDHATGGRFVLGLGAGWHEREHEAFGVPLPPIGERIDRLISAVETISAILSAERVTRDDPFYPLRDAIGLPAPLIPGGPPIWLGGQKRRGIRLAARLGSGWFLPGINAGDAAYFADRRDALLRELDAAGRDPATFTFAGQVMCDDLAALGTALAKAREMRRAGADHVILGLRARHGPDGLREIARQVAEPLAAESA